ncbi:hypothetical protein MTR67_012032 [Solanum verrucosum]|uniref:Uncharacterized protein n=1 Tax=Solanum verrucosum TaxID=315347 RepID=A0AAF0Q934_SOLVR|nr:hypothetical protein MTR67_012032 [Solanum verrucosum]
MGVVQSGAFQRDAKQRESLLRWMSRHIAEDGESTKWIQNTTLPIRKATLSFAAKFFWEASVPSWNYDRLLEAMKTMNVGLIKDDANPATPRKGP